MPRVLVGLLLLLAIVCPRTSFAGDALETYGDVAQIAIPGFAFVVSAWKRDANGALQLGVGTVATMGTVYAFKYGLDTERPNGGGKSFPSGHTAGAFAGASYLHYRYGWKWGFPAYAAAAVVGYSRVEADKHHWYDVVGAAAIANLFAFIVTDSFDENVVIIPMLDIGKHNFGLLAQFQF